MYKRQDVSIGSFSANGNVLGDASLSIDNSLNQDSYNLEFIIKNKRNNIFDLAGVFKIEDDDYPMNFKLITRNFNIAPFSAIGENVLQNFKGYFNSDIDVTGTFYKPIFEGYINAVDSSYDVPYLGLRYGFVDDPTFTLNNQTINCLLYTSPSPRDLH